MQLSQQPRDPSDALRSESPPGYYEVDDLYSCAPRQSLVPSPSFACERLQEEVEPCEKLLIDGSPLLVIQVSSPKLGGGLDS